MKEDTKIESAEMLIRTATSISVEIPVCLYRDILDDIRYTDEALFLTLVRYNQSGSKEVVLLDEEWVPRVYAHIMPDGKRGHVIIGNALARKLKGDTVQEYFRTLRDHYMDGRPL